MKNIPNIYQLKWSLDDQTFHQYACYILNSNRNKVLKLVKEIKSQKEINVNKLIYKLYGKNDVKSKVNFNQLCYQAFQLFQDVIVQQPNFLFNNLLINKSFDIKKVAFYKNVALWVEDFEYLMALYHFLNKKNINGYITLKEYGFYNETNFLYHKLFHDQENDLKLFYTKKIKPSVTELNKYKEYFNHDSVSISIIAHQSFILLNSICYPENFYKKRNFFKKLINEVQLKLKKHPLNKFHTLTNKLLSIDYALIKLERQFLKENELTNLLQSTLSKWKSKVDENNLTQVVFPLTIMGSEYLTKYFLDENMPVSVKKDIKKQILILDQIENQLKNQEKFSLNKIYINIIKGVFLLLNNNPDLCLKNIETMLFHYQQASFKKFYDEVFVLLMLSYVLKRDNDKIIETYKRYKLNINKEYLIKENHDLIKSIYHIVKYKETKSNYHLLQLKGLESSTSNNLKNKNMGLIKKIQQHL